MSVVEAVQAVLALGLPLLAFQFVRRRAAHTRAQLVIAAAIGGGVSGAVAAVVGTMSGASFEDAFPLAVFSLGFGAFVGLVGVVALSLGRWLSRLP